jgi:multisubunit Na+/H+ antiporter MnhC subunit
MSDERPRPQYGEYATPEQQLAAGGLPPVAQKPVVPTVLPIAPPQQSGQPQPRRWDRILSIGLLAYGLYSVIVSIVQFSNLDALMNQAYELQGIGEFSSTELAGTLGIAMIVTQIVIYLATLVITMALLRRGRLAFWVPLAGGVLAGLIVAVCLIVLMTTDPAFIDYVTEMGAPR